MGSRVLHWGINFDYDYYKIADDVLRNHRIKETIASELSVLWKSLIHLAFRELPGLSKENKNKGVYWLLGFRHTPVRAELAPNRFFYPFAGFPAPERGWREETGLALALWFTPPLPDRRESSRLEAVLTVQRAVPVKALLSLWNDKRDELKKLIETAEPTSDSNALDRYWSTSGRRHWIQFTSEFKRGERFDEIMPKFLALARIYHVLQGTIRKDCRRVSLLV
ncbi:MAG: hypothetical protein HYS38_05460 [Acidobacteria bacterium]|nr:hypothetical protein [Acidobacteriota bacterium]